MWLSGDPVLLVFDVDEDAVALVEGAALDVLAAEAHGRAAEHQRAKRDRLGHAVVEGMLAAAHVGALFEQLFDFGMDVEVRGIRGESCRRWFGSCRDLNRYRLRARRDTGRPGSGSSIRASRPERAFCGRWRLSSALRRTRSAVPSPSRRRRRRFVSRRARRAADGF